MAGFVAVSAGALLPSLSTSISTIYSQVASVVALPQAKRGPAPESGFFRAGPLASCRACGAQVLRFWKLPWHNGSQEDWCARHSPAC